MPAASTSYRVTAVYYIDTDHMLMKSKLAKIKQSGTSIIILHHHDLDEVLHIFRIVCNLIAMLSNYMCTL